MTFIAGRLLLPDVMAHLATGRPVFHSEADFQFAFAQAVTDLDPTVRVRLEVPRRGVRRTYVDLLCAAGEQTSLIELKYFTRAWTGTDGRTREVFDLRSHAAHDLARLYFVHDVTRLEAWTREQPDTSAFAVMLTNDRRLWEPPRSSRPSRDANFRIHQDRTVMGNLTWGTTDRPHPPNDRALRGTYVADWHEYSGLDTSTGGTLRWLGWAVTA